MLRRAGQGDGVRIRGGALAALLRLIDRVRDAARRRRWTPDQALGRRGEDMAHRRLTAEGYIVVARNYRLPDGSGEVDIIAWEGETLAFVEVKSRATAAYGAPDRAIGRDKLRAMDRGARFYARRAGVDWERVRFDTVSVVFEGGVSVELKRDAYPAATRV